MKHHVYADSIKGVVALAALLLLSSCMVGPNYHQPDAHLPGSWFSSLTGNVHPAVQNQSAVEQEWWKHFKDATLDQLIEKASAGNLDLKLAQERIAQARTVSASARADLLPSVKAKGAVARQANLFTFADAPPAITKPFNTFQAGFDASWEPDLFGGKRREIEADTAALEAAQASRDEVRVSLLAEVARTYVAIRQYQAQLAVAEDVIASDRHTVSIAAERYQSGSTPKLDLIQAQAQLDESESQIAYYENLLAQMEYSMDVLLGEQPGVARAITEVKAPIPVLSETLMMDAPANVIAHRPDIRGAERQLATATAQQGVAVAQLFPDISLSGFVGFLNVDAGDLFTAGSKSWSLGGNILSPVLNYGKLAAGIDAADSRQKQALITYQKAIIVALSDVERAVTAYTKQEEYRRHLSLSVADNRHAVEVARTRYKEGLSPFTEVLDAERRLYALENQLTQAAGQTSQNAIALYKSLGGSWQDKVIELPEEKTGSILKEDHGLDFQTGSLKEPVKRVGGEDPLPLSRENY